jgi:hypothetical protein
MRDSKVGEREISDFAKINHVFQDSWAWGVRAAQDNFFSIGISEAQEIPVIDSLATSSNRF